MKMRRKSINVKTYTNTSTDDKRYCFTRELSSSSPSNASKAGSYETSFPFGIYSTQQTGFSQTEQPKTQHRLILFLSGSADQVAFTYRKLGGDVLDIELTKEQVFAAYEEAVLEYSYILNIHQAKNTLSNSLGNATGSFDEDGMITEPKDADNPVINKSTHVSLLIP